MTRIFPKALLIALVGTLCCSMCYAKRLPNVQFVNAAPLPGSGNALNEDGKSDGQGALQLNIPVAYTPGDGYINLSAYAGEYFSKYNEKNWENGTGVLGMGFGKFPRVYVSAMAVSSYLKSDSKVASGQIQVLQETEKLPALAFGVQDVLNKEWKEFRTVFNTTPSYYAVSTKSIMIKDKKIYASLGYGSGRFLDTFFGGVSVPINDYFTAAIEHDGYQTNEVVTWRPTGRYSNVSLSAGYNGKCGPVVGANITGKASSAWAIPIFLFVNFYD